MARIVSTLTAVRELLLRRRIPPEYAWDARARTAPDWYVACSRNPDESERAAAAEVDELLSGIDRLRLKRWKVLEIGCGTGRWLKVLAPAVAEICGVDLSGEMIKLAQRRLEGIPNASVHKNDGKTLSMFGDGAFDFVFSVNVFQHIPDFATIDSYFQDIYRVLKSWGEFKLQIDGRGESAAWRFIRTVTGRDSWLGVIFSRAELLEIARTHGFEIISCGYGGGHGLRWALQDLWLHARKLSSGGTSQDPQSFQNERAIGTQVLTWTTSRPNTLRSTETRHVLNDVTARLLECAPPANMVARTRGIINA